MPPDSFSIARDAEIIPGDVSELMIKSTSTMSSTNVVDLESLTAAAPIRRRTDRLAGVLAVE